MENHERIHPEPEQSAEQREKPEFVYHGSDQADIEEFEPRTRYTPGALQGQEMPPAIYAGDDPAYAAAHAFPWGSAEGFNLRYEAGKVVLAVPEQLAHRLEQKVYIYKLSGDAFEVLPDVAPEGHNFWSKVHTKPVEQPVAFDSVREAIEHFGGEIRIIPEKTTP